MERFYSIIDKALIHTSKQRGYLVSGRNKVYKCVYLPPYSSELNPFKMCWKVLKDRARREKLTETERVAEASEEAPVEHIQNFTQHLSIVINL